MDNGEVGCRVLGVAGGDPAPAFEMQEGVLHEMPQFIAPRDYRAEARAEGLVMPSGELNHKPTI